MDRVFNTVVDRTRSRLDVPKLRTLFGSKGRPHRKPGSELSPRRAVVIEKPQWNLTIFKVRFGLLTLAEGYTKGEASCASKRSRDTKQLGLGQTLNRLAQITSRLTAMVDRFTSMLCCVDVGFLSNGTFEQLPAPWQLGQTRIGGLDINRPRARTTLAAALALAVAPQGFTVAQFTAQMQAIAGQTPDGYSIRQAA